MKCFAFSLPVFILQLSFTNYFSAQNFGTKPGGSLLNPNAMPDLKSSNEGILIPKTSTSAGITVFKIQHWGQFAF